jgi:hypothetical protein
MATDPELRSSSNGHAPHRDSLAKWLLGALGLLWLGGLAVRALRSERLGRADEANRLTPTRLTREPRPVTRPPRAHETRDVNVKWIFGIVLFLFLSGLAMHGLLAWYLKGLKGGAAPTDRWRLTEGAAHTPLARPPMPRLQVSAPLDLQAFRGREEAQLHTYGWINRTSGIVRIPIEQAMEALLREGLPTRSTNNEKSQAGPSSYQLIQQRLDHRELEIHP